VSQAATLDELAAEISGSRKYRHLNLPPETVRDLLRQAQAEAPNPKQAVKLARHKLHNLVAPYLGDPDYSRAALELEAAFASGEESAVRAVCAGLLNSHASTRERMPHLELFYRRLFERTGRPETLLDLACGLNPFAFPWMGLPVTMRYHAYDLHGPRIALINTYFRLQGLQPLAEQVDLVLHPPQLPASLAFFFKEAHRFEQRQRGASRALLAALPVRTVVVSLPAASLTGRHDLTGQQRRLIESITTGTDWTVWEMEIGDEMVFGIEKQNGR